MKKIYLLALMAVSMSAYSQLTYTNGPLSTGATTTTGTAAPTGYTWSELQTVNGLSTTSYGLSAFYNNLSTSNYTVADDFVVPAGETWIISSIDFFCYQTSYTGTTPPLDALRVRILNGTPGTSTAVAGNLTSNVYNSAGSADGLMYRTSSTAGTTRKIWKVKGNISATLSAGTYWVDYQAHATNDGLIYFPTVTVVGSNTNAAWNAQQSTSGVYTAAVDGGTSLPVAMPFVVNYTTTNLGVTESRQFDSRIQVYPNPVLDYFKLSLPPDVKVNQLELIDTSGRIVKKMKAADQYNVSDIKTGVYMVKIHGNSVIKTLQLIKK